MNMEEFRERGSYNKIFKVAGLAFDRTFFPEDALEDGWKVFLFAFASGAISKYFNYAPISEPGHIYALMKSLELLVGGAGLLFMAKIAAAKSMKYIRSIDEVLKELKYENKTLGQVRVDIICEQQSSPIKEELLSQYLSAKFKGMGTNENYMPQLLKDIEILRKLPPAEVQRFAVMLYESKVMVHKPGQFNEWVKIFFNIVGMKCPKYISKSKHKPTQEMINHFYYINLP